MMYKVFRDRARVYALMRKKDKAQECHNKTEELINDYFPEVLPNIKIGKLRLLKSIWMSKFDQSLANQYAGEAYQIFIEIDSESNYFAACCLLELGNGHLTEKDHQNSHGFLDQAMKNFETNFPAKHPIYAKYLQYAIEAASFADDKDTLIALGQEVVDLVTEVNGPQSIFVADALLTQMSVLSQINEYDKAKEVNDKLFKLFENNKIVNGTHIRYQAQTLCALMLIKQDKLRDAEEKLSKNLVEYATALKGK